MINLLLLTLLSFSLSSADLSTPVQEALYNTFSEAALINELEKMNGAIIYAASGDSLEKKIAIDAFKVALDTEKSGLRGKISDQVKQVLDQIQANIKTLSLKTASALQKNQLIFLASGAVAGLVAYYLSKPAKKAEDTNETEYVKSLQNRITLISVMSILGGISGVALFGAKTVDTWGMQFGLDYLRFFLENKDINPQLIINK
jgi:hypothetical protein